MSVAAAKRAKPSGTPPFAAVVRCISAIICAFVTAAFGCANGHPGCFQRKLSDTALGRQARSTKAASRSGACKSAQDGKTARSEADPLPLTDGPAVIRLQR